MERGISPDRSWNEEVGDVIAAIGSPDFAAVLVEALRRLVPFDYSVIFAYCGDARPIDLYDDFPTAKRRIFVTKYQEGPYMLDPFFLASKTDLEPGLYRLKDLAPDRFYQSEYFRSYYVQTGLSEEMCYFVALPDAVNVVVSLMRADPTPAFNTREFNKLQSARPIVRAAVERNWLELNRRFSDGATDGDQGDLQQYIDYAFRNFGRSILTPRERDVVEYVLKGYSSEAIGNILEIATGTVRIHRKNIYAKLGINSQGALFSQFIRALSNEARTG
jgi:DNA-binding CsgD family transcriptional regulator